MTLIDKKQLLSDIVNLKMSIGISSQDIDATYIDVDPIYVEGYCAGKSEMQSKIIDIINKQRVAELEKPKKKRKFRAMTNGEYCYKYSFCGECPMFDKRTNDCSTPFFKDNDLFRTKNGKYILVEVKE